MDDRVRTPIVAGAFYPAHAGPLRRMIDDFLPLAASTAGRSPGSMGLIAPHAGYVYSGRVAAEGYAAVAAHGSPDVVVVLGASHTGVGPRVALAPYAAWETPLGRSLVDREIVRRLLGAGLSTAELPFVREHSIEVQIPFIQHLWGTDCPIVPICVVPGPQAEAQAAAMALAGALAERRALVVASSDFTHYQPQAVAEASDRNALEYILALDASGFRGLCRERALTICGTGAIDILMAWAAHASLTSTRLVAYATSGNVTADESSVVGYASVLFAKETHG